jgi:glutaredoxin 3
MEKVILYSTPVCPYCVALKGFFEDNNIEFEEKDVSADQVALERMIEKTGAKGVPVVEIGEEFVIGFDREKISELLKINKK